MAVAFEETEAEILVFLDADVENFAPHFVHAACSAPCSSPDDVRRW